MPFKLGELLLQHNLITQAQLEEALQAQVIFGGKLGTILIEMGMISEKILAKALSKLTGFPCAQPGQLETIPENVINIISPEQADKYKVIPMAVSGKKLTLAMADPQNLQAIDDIAFRTGYIVLPILALEVRLIFALERFYDIKRTTRYIAPPKQVREELDQLDIIKDKEPTAAVLKEEEFLGAPGSEQILAEAAEAPPEPEPEPEEEIEEIEDLDEVEVTLEDMARELIEARDRDGVADAIIGYLGNQYARAVLFMVVAGQVTGWRSTKNGQPIAGFDEFQLPLDEPSVLKTAVESQSYFLGPIPKGGANLALTTLLGKPAPATALLMPLSMLGRVVGLIYVDDSDLDLSEALINVQTVASKALTAFEILILQNKILRL
jgi:hypothetical protein